MTCAFDSAAMDRHTFPDPRRFARDTKYMLQSLYSRSMVHRFGRLLQWWPLLADSELHKDLAVRFQCGDNCPCLPWILEHFPWKRVCVLLVISGLSRQTASLATSKRRAVRCFPVTHEVDGEEEAQDAENKSRLKGTHLSQNTLDNLSNNTVRSPQRDTHLPEFIETLHCLWQQLQDRT